MSRECKCRGWLKERVVMADLQQTVGLVIRRERRLRGLTMKALAKRAAVSLVYLGEIERGKKYPSALVLERLAEALDLDVWDVLDLVASDLRAEARRQPVEAIGVALPPRVTAASRASGDRAMRMSGAAESMPLVEVHGGAVARTGKVWLPDASDAVALVSHDAAA